MRCQDHGDKSSRIYADHSYVPDEYYSFSLVTACDLSATVQVSYIEIVNVKTGYHYPGAVVQ